MKGTSKLQKRAAGRLATRRVWWYGLAILFALSSIAVAPSTRPSKRTNKPKKAAPAKTKKDKVPTRRAAPTPRDAKPGKSPARRPAARAAKLPKGFGSIDFPPLPKSKRPKARKRRKRRKRRRRRKTKPLVIPHITPAIAQDAAKLGLIIEQLKKRHWRLQRRIVEQLSQSKGKTTQALHKALSHKHLRVRLLVAQALGLRKDPKALPMLRNESARLYDQPAPLLMGAWIAHGTLAVPALIQAIGAGGHIRQYLRALGYLRAAKGLPVLARYATAPDRELRIAAREALQRYPVGQMVSTIAQVLAKTPTSSPKKRRGRASPRTEKGRAALVRMLAYQPTAAGMALLVARLTDPSGAIRFLARLSLEDQVEQLHKAAPRDFAKKPKSKRADAWQAWWHKHQKKAAAWYKADRKRRELKAMPTKNLHHIRLLYRTIHPVFGYGRMPLLVHDAAWKKPTPPQAGKLWHVALPSAQFAALCKQLQDSGFFRWTPRMGRIRDLTVYAGKRKHRVSIGLVRHMGFERLEQIFLKLAKSKKLGLRFNDFYRRRDDADVVGEGQIGQWAFRSGDRLPKRSWNPRKGWKPEANIEGAWAVLRDIIRYLPSRTRLISIDARSKGLRISTLLFGSRSQSRLTRDGALRSKRVYGFKTIGLGPHYLSTDKIERMIFELSHRPFPWASRSSPRKGKKLGLLHLFRIIWPRTTSQLLSLRFERGRPHRITAMWKTKGTHSLLQSLAHLALHSRGDRLLALRINASGQPDRHRYKIIVQMQWEMLSPVSASKMPRFLKLDRPTAHEPFTPVYR